MTNDILAIGFIGALAIVATWPAVAILVYVPKPWNIASLALLMFPVAYVGVYLFTRDTDPAWPVGPAERVLFEEVQE